MEKLIVQPGEHRFVLLRFTSGSGDQAQRATALLLVEDGGTLKIYTEKQWEPGFHPEEQEYLNQLLHDWRSASADRVAALLDQLAELSVGPLRAVKSGVADAEKLATLMAPFQ